MTYRLSSIYLLLISLTLSFSRATFAADDEAAKSKTGVPPIPPVLSVTPLGTVQQNSDILGRDGTFSALINGESVWTFGRRSRQLLGRQFHVLDDQS